MSHPSTAHTRHGSKLMRGSGLLLIISVIAGILILLVAHTSYRGQATAAPNDGTNIRSAAARYNANGELKRPTDHRQWVFIGAPVTPNDLNGGKAAFPEFHNVYIDPDSFADYQRTGEFSDGTMIVKELVTVGGTSMPSGQGYFQGEFVSLEAMVKDTRRFTAEPGGWAFFRFGEAPDYKPVGARMETTACNSCHAGGDEDYVFTSTYPVLRAAKPEPATP